jgi:hypothetical protein
LVPGGGGAGNGHPRQLSQLYSSLKLERLNALVPFCNRDELESLLLQAVQDNVLSLRIDHVGQAVHFGVNLFAYSVSPWRAPVFCVCVVDAA